MRCKWCEEKMESGEEYIEFEDDYYHKDCFEDNCLDIVDKKFGIGYGTIEEDDDYDAEAEKADFEIKNAKEEAILEAMEAMY